MTKLSDTQAALQRAIHENPRVLWALSSVAIAKCRAADKAFLSEVVAAKNAARPTRAYNNFTGSLSVNTTALQLKSKALLDSIDYVIAYTNSVKDYVPDSSYELIESSDYDTAVRNKGLHSIVTDRPWGNFDSGKTLVPVLSEYQITSANGPFKVQAPVTYTVKGVAVQIPASVSYVRSRREPFVFSVVAALQVKMAGVPTACVFPVGTYTAAQVVTILEAAGIESYAEDGIVTINDTDSAEVIATPAAAVLGFPVGTTRTTAPYTDCDDVAELLGASVVRNTLSQEISVVEGMLVSDHDDVIGDALLSILKYPFGTYLVKNDEVAPYFGGALEEYQGPAWILQERLDFVDSAPFAITSSGADPLNIVGKSSGKSNVLKDTFSIVPRVGDIILGMIAGLPDQVVVTSVLAGKSVTVNKEVYSVRDWKLVPPHYIKCDALKSLRSSVAKIYDYLNVRQPENKAEMDAYMERFAEAESLYNKIRPKLSENSASDANNEVSNAIYADLRQSGYDIAADTLARGDISSFFLLNDITANSAKMLAVYRSSL